MSIEIGQPQDVSLGAFALPSVPTGDAYKISQEDIPAGKTAGVLFEFYVLNSGRVFAKVVYDGVFRPAFAELGYEMSESTLSSEPLTVAWAKYEGESLDADDKSAAFDQWWLNVTSGPKRLLGEDFGFTTADPALDVTSVNLAKVKSAAVYRVLLRPRDEILTLNKVKTLTRKVSELKSTLGQNTEQRARAAFVIRGVNPIPGHAALWLTLIGIGAAGIVSAAKKRK